MEITFEIDASDDSSDPAIMTYHLDLEDGVFWTDVSQDRKPFKQDEQSIWWTKFYNNQWTQMFTGPEWGLKLKKAWEEAIDKSQLGE